MEQFGLFAGLLIWYCALTQKDVSISKVAYQGCRVSFIAENKVKESIKAKISIHMASVNFKGITRDIASDTITIILSQREQRDISKLLNCVHPGNVVDVNVIETQVVQEKTEDS